MWYCPTKRRTRNQGLRNRLDRSGVEPSRPPPSLTTPAYIRRLCKKVRVGRCAPKHFPNSVIPPVSASAISDWLQARSCQVSLPQYTSNPPQHTFCKVGTSPNGISNCLPGKKSYQAAIKRNKKSRKTAGPEILRCGSHNHNTTQQRCHLRGRRRGC